MSKSYWHSAGSGALGSAGPWHAEALICRIERLTALQRAGRTLLYSLVLAVLGGMVIGIYQDLSSGLYDAGESGRFAYRCLGLTVNQAFASGMMALSLGGYVSIIHNNVLFYLEIPYQICAFAGAFCATGVLSTLQQLLLIIAFAR